MKTTVEIPELLFKKVKTYAHNRKRTFKDVLIDALTRIVADTNSARIEPEWKQCFGRFRGSRTETAEIQAIIDRDLSSVDSSEWK